MTGRTVVITGATSRIGEASALALARAGADLVVIARDPAKAARTAALVHEIPGAAPVRLVDGDLSSMAGVRRAAVGVAEVADSIDVLLNNAGVFPVTSRVTVDGHEEMLATNYLGPFLLTHLLLDRMGVTAPSRIVNVSSTAHRFVWGFDPERLERIEPYDGVARACAVYARTKLLDVLMTDELARRLHGTGITANSVCPGTVGTSITRETASPACIEVLTAVRAVRTPEVGARASVYLASSAEVAGITGRFFASPALGRSSAPLRSPGRCRARRDPAIARRAYERTCALLDVEPVAAPGRPVRDRDDVVVATRG